MPIITPIGRKAWSIRLIVWSIYTVLSVGAITMIYPFLMMLSLSVSSYADFKENRLVPRYFYSEDALFRKFANVKYIELDQFNMRRRSRYPEFGYGGEFEVMSSSIANWPRIVAVPFDLSDPRIKARIEDYNQFKRGFLKDHWLFTECLYLTNRSQSTINPLLDRCVAFLLKKYGSLEGVNRAYYEQTRELREIYPIRERPTYRTYLPPRTLKMDDWQELKRQLVAEDLEFVNIGDIEPEWGRFLESKYSSEDAFNTAFGTDYRAFYQIPLPFTAPPGGPGEREKLWREHWIEFAKNRVPLRYMSVRDPDGRWQEFLRGRHSTIEELNKAYETEYAAFGKAAFPSEINYNSVTTTDIYSFIGSDAVAPEDITIRSPRWYWTEFLKAKYGTLEEANRAHSITYADWTSVEVPRRLPLNQTRLQQEEWRLFVRTACPLDDLLGNFSRKRLASYTRSEYANKISQLNAAWGTEYTDFKQARLPKRGKIGEAQARDLRKMLDEQVVPLAEVEIPETVSASLYQEFLKARHDDVASYNKAIALYPSWDLVQQPLDEVEWADFTAKRKEFSREFLTGNYRAVVNFMALQGSRPFLNTALLCAAMILAALTVNPLCAYALCRFQLSYANSILLFLLATMAFPVAVTQIPNFLMLKNLHMLNTYWALILPTLANGYSIFLLKGFFDSLPQELFEAGLIDGASEVQMFYRIALPLTKPILAVIALGAFTVAYGEFMWAFVVCQSRSYWTIMVFLYQFQQDYSVPLLMAGLVLASVPTLIVFIATQKVTLQGIVVPQMK